MDELIEKLRLFRDERNWKQFHTPKDLAISISIEAAELLECFQWNSNDVQPEPDSLDKIRDEVADVLLYLLLFCDSLNIDAVQSAHAKIEKNGKRFPVSTSCGIAKPEDVTAPR